MTRKKYASDINRERFAEIEPLLRSARRRTKPTTVDSYEVFCAMLYLLRTDYQWRFLPSEFTKRTTVYAYFSKRNQPDQHGVSLLEQALKKIRLPWPAPDRGATPQHDVPSRGYAEREEHRHGST